MKLPQEEIDRRVQEAAKTVGILEEDLQRSPFDLSGGQKRRVAIAGVLAMEPELLILDEPTAGLDPQGAESILEMLSEFRHRTGAAVLMVSHSMEEVASYADKIIVMNHAEVAEDGTPDEVFAHAEQLTAMGLDIPQVTSLFLKLKESGLAVPDAVYTVDDAVAALSGLFGGAEK